MINVLLRENHFPAKLFRLNSFLDLPALGSYFQASPNGFVAVWKITIASTYEMPGTAVQQVVNLSVIDKIVTVLHELLTREWSLYLYSLNVQKIGLIG